MPTNLDLFAYLAAFVSVILALAVSDWLQSLQRLLRARKRVRWNLVAILAACLVFLSILEEFFDMWRLAGVERFTYVDLLTLIFPPIVISLAAMTVLPDEVPAEGLDLADHYMENRRLVYLLLSLWVFGIFVKVSDLHQLITGREGSAVEILGAFPWQTIPVFLFFALMAWFKDMRIQLIGLVTNLILVNSSMIDRSLEVARAG
jgi:TM2 domain-containing membrane protein YozV